MKFIMHLLFVLILCVLILYMPIRYVVATWSLAIRLGLLLLLFFEIAFILKMIAKSKLKDRIKNNLTSLFSIVIILVLLECIFMFVPRSHGVGYTLGAKIWKKKYWHPINSYGYRDNEPKKADKSILFVGDSFTAGHGVKDIEDRFSNVFADSIETINIGKDGADTRMEYENTINFIKQSDIKPFAIVLQYFGNDIEVAASEHNKSLKRHAPYNDVPRFFELFIKGSYLLNYIYWLYPHSDSKPYIDFLSRAYKNQEIFESHKRDLKKIIDFSNDNSISLYVVIFPFLVSPETSKDIYVDSVKAFFDKHYVKTIDVSVLVENVDVKDRIVNSSDAHSSPLVNLMIAESLENLIKLDD